MIIDQFNWCLFKLKACVFYSYLVKNGTLPAHARWTLRDAMDRTVIRRALAARDAVFLL